MTMRAFRSRLVYDGDGGRSFHAKWYKMANDLILVAITVTKDGKNAYVTHAANLKEDSAEAYAEFEQNRFYKQGENERDCW